MTEDERDTKSDELAESSKAGAKRMRRLVSSAKLGGPSTSAIHPITSHLIYPSSSPVFAGHLLTPLFSPRAPRPLPTPPILTAGRELSISPCGEWVIIFHPNLRVPNQVGEGGTLAIYSSSVLSPISKPTTRTTVPLATFPLPCDVLAVHHLYTPRLHLPPPHNRAKPRGPAPLEGYEPSQGPGLVVLTSTNLILLHPQVAGQPGATPSYVMDMLTCPLHTRWYAAPGGSMPPETGWRVDAGWIGSVADDEGVWVGWARKGQAGVIRAEIGVKDGRPYLLTTPMPPLPVADSMTADEGTMISTPKLQGMTFFAAPQNVMSAMNRESDSIVVDEADEEGPKRKVVCASLQYSATASEGSPRTYLKLVGFELREVELVEGFSEMGNSGDNDAGFTTPHFIRTITSPGCTSVLAFVPLPDIPPYTLCLAVVHSTDGPNLVHLDLCSNNTSAAWRTVGSGTPLDPNLVDQTLELVPSQAVLRGLRGLVAVVSKEAGATLVILPSIPTDGASPETTDVEDAATGIVVAIRQGVSYADVVRIALTAAANDDSKAVASDVIHKTFDLMQEDLTIDDRPQLHRLQVAIFSDRRPIAAELVKLYEASHIFNITAYASPTGTIAFDLDTVWSTLSVAEWVMTVLSDLFRSVVFYKGTAAWSTPVSYSNPNWTRLTYILVPEIRNLLVRLLAQTQAFKEFLETLEEPIMQPESRYMPIGRRRDPRATILARERARDLGVRDGVDISSWGRALETITDGSDDAEISGIYTTSYLTLDPSQLLALQSSQAILDALPSPASLLLAETVLGLHDGITFEPLQAGKGVMVRCDRCSWATKSLGFDLDLGGGDGVPGVGGERVGQGWQAYVDWRQEREGGCGCGGTWVRESVGTVAGASQG